MLFPITDNFTSQLNHPVLPSPSLAAGVESTASRSELPAAIAAQSVLHVINGEHFSGAERVQQLLGKRLPECGFEPYFGCVKPGKFRALCGLLENKLIDAPMRGRFDFSVVRNLATYATQHSVALLHAHTPRTALVTSLVARRTGLPWIYHVHSPTARDSTRGWVNQMSSLIERFSIRSCDCLITVSESLATEMRRRCHRQRVVMVANGVPAIEPINAKERLSQATWRLGIVALMRPRKGVEVALEAMQRLKQANCPATLELIGGFETPEYERHILGMIERLQIGDCVRWTGFTQDVPTALRQLDALLLPSLFGEGMPMVVLEALAAAVPVIATRVEGTPEVVRDGVEGLLAEPRSVDSLVEKIQQLVSDRAAWAAMSSRACTRHRESFSDLRMAEGVAAVYRQVLGRHSTR